MFHISSPATSGLLVLELFCERQKHSYLSYYERLNIVTPQFFTFLEPQNVTLLGNSVFTDVISQDDVTLGLV